MSFTCFKTIIKVPKYHLYLERSIENSHPCPLESPSKLGKNQRYIYIFPGVVNNAVVVVVQFHDPIRVKGQLKGPEGQLEGSKGQQEGSESQLEGPEGQMAGPEGQLKGSES